MKRRSILITAGGSLAGSLAGCINSFIGSESSTPPDESSNTSTSTSTRTTDDTRQRTVSLESQDEVPDTHQVSIEAELLESTITTAETANLQVTMINEGPKRAFRIAGGYCKLFNGPHAGSNNPSGLWLYQPNETEYLDRKEDRWVPDRPQSESRAFPASACSPQEYKSGESLNTEYEVWDDYQVDVYLQPATYRWEQGIEIWDDSEARATDSPTAKFTWGFSLSIENVESS